VVEEFERAYIAGVLEAHGGRVGLAAKHAGLDSKNLSAKVSRYGLRKSAAPTALPPTVDPGGGAGTSGKRPALHSTEPIP
jgi:hypothetical protein